MAIESSKRIKYSRGIAEMASELRSTKIKNALERTVGTLVRTLLSVC